MDGSGTGIARCARSLIDVRENFVVVEAPFPFGSWDAHCALWKKKEVKVGWETDESSLVRRVFRR